MGSGIYSVSSAASTACTSEDLFALELSNLANELSDARRGLSSNELEEQSEQVSELPLTAPTPLNPFVQAQRVLQRMESRDQNMERLQIMFREAPILYPEGPSHQKLLLDVHPLFNSSFHGRREDGCSTEQRFNEPTKHQGYS
jgi:hypothetical protein